MDSETKTDKRTGSFSLRTSRAFHVTGKGMLTNGMLLVVKLAAGFAGKSNAMIADGFHSLSDFITDFLVLWGFRETEKPADHCHDYGHGKIETLVTSVIGIGLFIVGIKIFWSGAEVVVGTVRGHPLVRPGWIAFYAALLSLGVKEWMYRYTVKVGREIKSQAVIANAWHHRSDSLSSLAAFIGIGGAIVLGEKWRVLDPLAAIAVSFFIARTALSIARESFQELIEASLSDETEEEILLVVESVEGVRNPHNMKTRKIGNDIAVDIHIEVDKNMNIVQAHEISSQVETKLKQRFGSRTFVSVHVEPSR